jgi:mannose-6-phosphate isomerase-like protein (cupin superfamily)
MTTKIAKKITMYLLLAIAGYLAIGYLFHLVIFPEGKPPISSYFKPNDIFYSKVEGFKQHVEKQENGFVYCTLVLEPLAEGPPKHIHTGFDEEFEVSNGELTLWVDGEIKKIHPGEKILVPRGTPHKPYNETTESINVKGTIAFPEKFAYHLPQVYGVMEETPDLGPAIMLQMALFNTSGFDSYIAEGPPVVVQKVIGFVLVPLARLLGYRSYYTKYDINDRHL